ncbi:DUF695 domain-containing protein [uncultured Algoriphagus sp.]|uniref:DUF695 domain-containing protein n=1 Tax=uncultured Algoriphagus sp. TaxID=417365 RepID=UPI00258DE14B|nr:DUF695 domain-containing protein [uncultured Algoriphagus sp.]
MKEIPKHQEQWEFYFGQVDYKLTSINVDLGLRDIAPIKGLSNVGYITVKMNNPREDGLSSQEESETLFQMEDSLIKAATKDNNSIYIGRNTSDNNRELYFYIANTVIWDKQVSETMAQFPTYQYDHGHKPDESWGGYFDFLYPAPQEMQSILNRRVIAQLEQGGDPLTKEREVNHWINFKTEPDREKYAEQVKADGFKIEDMSYNGKDDFPYSLRISRIDKVDYGSIDDYTIGLWQLAAKLNGDYDGWETSIEKE